MEIPLLQSDNWAGLQDALGEEYLCAKEKEFSYLAILKKTPVGNYLYLPYGPVAESKSGFKKALESLKKQAEKTHSIFIRIEPQNPNFIKLLPKNSKKTTDLNPKETWVLDLSPEDIKGSLPQRLLRYYKNAEKNDIKIKTSHNPEDIKHLIELQSNLAKSKNINIFSENYLKTELSQPFATLYLVEHQNQIIAAGLVFDDDSTRYNLQGAQSEQGRKLHATGILTIQLILDAKAKKLKCFDFWGIAPENAPKSHPWKGFTAFKKTFKGEEVIYAGTYDIIMNRFRYSIYNVFRKFNRFLRKV